MKKRLQTLRIESAFFGIGIQNDVLQPVIYLSFFGSGCGLSGKGGIRNCGQLERIWNAGFSAN
jgi:hypothetical protein